MDYLCGKFGDSSFSRFGSIVRTYRQQTPTHTRARAHTHTQTDEDERFTPATLVSVSNKTDKLITTHHLCICALTFFTQNQN